MWYHYRQNNSGGSFDIVPEEGIGPHLYIEAKHSEQADQLAMDLGLYFEGVEAGLDCDCCGDRWEEVYYGEDKIDISKYSFLFHDEVYLHPIDGPFIVIRGAK